MRARDYTIEGDQLTLTASALTRLSGSRGYGTNAVLTARFSHGEPWRFHVITHDTPVLSDATGTTASRSTTERSRPTTPVVAPP